jgi:hypothetical protein
VPGGYKNINGNDGVKFGEGQKQGTGRKKKIYTILKEKGYSKDDIKTAFGELAFYTLDELKKVYQDEKMPVITRIVANQFFVCLKKADWSKIKEIMHYINENNSEEEKETNITFNFNNSDMSIEDLNDGS